MYTTSRGMYLLLFPCCFKNLKCSWSENATCSNTTYWFRLSQSGVTIDHCPTNMFYAVLAGRLLNIW